MPVFVANVDWRVSFDVPTLHGTRMLQPAPQDELTRTVPTYALRVAVMVVSRKVTELPVSTSAVQRC